MSGSVVENLQIEMELMRAQRDAAHAERDRIARKLEAASTQIFNLRKLNQQIQDDLFDRTCELANLRRQLGKPAVRRP